MITILIMMMMMRMRMEMHKIIIAGNQILYLGFSDNIKHRFGILKLGRFDLFDEDEDDDAITTI